MIFKYPKYFGRFYDTPYQHNIDAPDNEYFQN